MSFQTFSEMLGKNRLDLIQFDHEIDYYISKSQSMWNEFESVLKEFNGYTEDEKKISLLELYFEYLKRGEDDNRDECSPVCEAFFKTIPDEFLIFLLTHNLQYRFVCYRRNLFRELDKYIYYNWDSQDLEFQKVFQSYRNYLLEIYEMSHDEYELMRKSNRYKFYIYGTWWLYGYYTLFENSNEYISNLLNKAYLDDAQDHLLNCINRMTDYTQMYEIFKSIMTITTSQPKPCFYPFGGGTGASGQMRNIVKTLVHSGKYSFVCNIMPYLDESDLGCFKPFPEKLTIDHKMSEYFNEFCELKCLSVYEVMESFTTCVSDLSSLEKYIQKTIEEDIKLPYYLKSHAERAEHIVQHFPLKFMYKILYVEFNNDILSPFPCLKLGAIKYLDRMWTWESYLCWDKNCVNILAEKYAEYFKEDVELVAKPWLKEFFVTFQE